MLSRDEMPRLLRRAHIKRGYRPLHQPSGYYLQSAFAWHNELVNIWTHFLPVFYLLAVYIYPEVTSPAPRFPVLLLCTGTFILLVGSSMAHLLHSRSTHDHVFWYLVDFAGIAIFALSIGIQRFGCQSDLHPWLELLYLPSLVVVGVLCQFLSTSTLFVLHPHWPARDLVRMVTCFLLALWLYIPICHRYLSSDVEVDAGLRHHNRAFQWLLVSGIFMGGGVPERFAPGFFDLVGYGHQLFHICVIMIGWNLLEGADSDCSAESVSGWMKSVGCAATALLACTLIAHTVLSLSRSAKQRKYE